MFFLYLVKNNFMINFRITLISFKGVNFKYNSTINRFINNRIINKGLYANNSSYFLIFSDSIWTTLLTHTHMPPTHTYAPTFSLPHPYSHSHAHTHPSLTHTHTCTHTPSLALPINFIYRFFIYRFYIQNYYIWILSTYFIYEKICK